MQHHFCMCIVRSHTALTLRQISSLCFLGCLAFEHFQKSKLSLIVFKLSPTWQSVNCVFNLCVITFNEFFALLYIGICWNTSKWTNKTQLVMIKVILFALLCLFANCMILAHMRDLVDAFFLFARLDEDIYCGVKLISWVTLVQSHTPQR